MGWIAWDDKHMAWDQRSEINNGVGVLSKHEGVGFGDGELPKRYRVV